MIGELLEMATSLLAFVGVVVILLWLLEGIAAPVRRRLRRFLRQDWF
jgi:hypothetical protein